MSQNSLWKIHCRLGLVVDICGYVTVCHVCLCVTKRHASGIPAAPTQRLTFFATTRTTSSSQGGVRPLGGGTSLKATPGTSKLMKSPWVATVKSPWILRLATDSQPVATELLSTSVHKDHETCSVCSSWNAFGIRENPSWASLKASASACGEPGPLARTLRFYQDSSGMLWRCFDKSFRHKPQILLDLFPNQFNLLMTGSVQAHKPKSHPN